MLEGMLSLTLMEMQAAQFETPPLPVQLLTKGRAHRAPKIDTFLDFAARKLSALPVLHPD